MRREPQVSGRQLCGCPPSLPRFDASRELSEEGAKVGNGEKHSGWAEGTQGHRGPCIPESRSVDPWGWAERTGGMVGSGQVGGAGVQNVWAL